MKYLLVALGMLGLAAYPTAVVNPQAGGSGSDPCLGGTCDAGSLGYNVVGSGTQGPVTSNGVPLVGLPTWGFVGPPTSEVGTGAGNPVEPPLGAYVAPAGGVIDRIRFYLNATNQASGTTTTFTLQFVNRTTGATCGVNLPCNWDAGSYALTVATFTENLADMPVVGNPGGSPIAADCAFNKGDIWAIQAADAGTGALCAASLIPINIQAVAYLTDGGV
jgi:hypothetical protein